MIVETFDEKSFKVQIEILPGVSKVNFIDGPINPVGTITMVTRGYKGIYEPNFPDESDREDLIKDIQSTKLQTPLEFGTIVFLVRGVPRSFTHQAVRTRIGASFVQESMRFLGHQKVYRVLVSRSLNEYKYRNSYFESLRRSVFEYELAISEGISSEDARANLPTDILTNIFVGYQISSFIRVYEQRMCCQAQPGVWQSVVRMMRNELIIKYGEELGKLISAPYERGEPCGYRASFDRPCKWQKE